MKKTNILEDLVNELVTPCYKPAPKNKILRKLYVLKECLKYFVPITGDIFAYKLIKMNTSKLKKGQELDMDSDGAEYWMVGLTPIKYLLWYSVICDTFK